MRFNCGPTAEELEAASDKAADHWHPVFAWWPIRIGKECHWLEYVERRREWLPFSEYVRMSTGEWEYRAMLSPAKQKETA